MKILDRYVLAAFLKNYLLSFMVLVGMYVVLDMVFNFDELAELEGQAGASAFANTLALVWSVAEFYFFQMFLIFSTLSGIIPIVAAAFTLLRFSRFNELVAMLAAGVPLLRVSLPIIVSAVVLNLVLLPIDQEILLPRMIDKLTRDHDKLHLDAGESFPINSLLDSEGNILIAGLYSPKGRESSATMQMVTIFEYDDQGDPVVQINADQAVWDEAAGRWNLVNGQRNAGIGRGSADVSIEPIDHYSSSITPEEIRLYRDSDTVSLLSTARINELLKQDRPYGTEELLRVKHSRFTGWLGNIVLLLLGVACVLSREPGAMKASVMKCLLVTGLCLTCIFIFQQLAGSPPKPQWADTWPAVMAWMPIFIFFPLSVWLLERVKS